MESKDNKSFIDEIKEELEELEEQLKKNSAEFKDNYKLKKQKIAGIIKKYAQEIEEIGGGKIHELKDSYKELLDLLEADYDFSYTEYENESHKISSALEEFEAKAKEIFQNLSSEARQTRSKLEKDLNKNLSKFKTELDIQKAHFKVTKDRATSGFEDWKEKRLKDIGELKTDLEHKKEAAEEKIEGISDEVSESFNHIKKAFKKLW